MKHPSRAPIRVTVDAGLRGRMVRTGVRVTLPPKVVAVRFLSWAVVGALLWLLTRSLLLLFVVALVVPALMIGTGLSRTLRRVGRAVREGSVVTSAYDDRGRLVITRDAGDLVLEEGTASSVERVGDVAVVRWRQRRGPMVTPSVLLTDDDVVRLTSAPPASELPYAVEITREVRHDMVIGVYGMLARHPIGIALILLVMLSTTLAVVTPNGPGRRLDAAATLLVVVFLALVWVGQRRIYRVGSTVRAGVTEDGLRLDVPFHPPLVPRAAIRRITRSGRCIVLTRRNGRRLALPRELLQPDALRDLTGEPARKNGAI